MLVLSRKVGERIVIGDRITIVVNRVSGNRVSLGIDAPADVRIVRGELADSRATFEPEEEPAEAPAPVAPAVALPSIEFSTEPLLHRAR